MFKILEGQFKCIKIIKIIYEKKNIGFHFRKFERQYKCYKIVKQFFLKNYYYFCSGYLKDSLNV